MTKRRLYRSKPVRVAYVRYGGKIYLVTGSSHIGSLTNRMTVNLVAKTVNTLEACLPPPYKDIN